MLVFRENTAPAVTPRGFVIREVHLYPTPGSHKQLAADELARLEQACRAWLATHWQLDATAARIVAIAGYNVTVQQESMEFLPTGIPGVRFSVAYER